MIIATDSVNFRWLITIKRPCKHKKVKCGEEKPGCLNCERQGEPCDYSIRLNWEGRTKRKANDLTPEPGQDVFNAGLEMSPPVSLTVQHSESSEFSMATPLSTEQSWESVGVESAQPSIERHLTSDGIDLTLKYVSKRSPEAHVGFKPFSKLSSYGQQQISRDGLSALQLVKLRDSTNFSSPYQMRSYIDSTLDDGNMASDNETFSPKTSHNAMLPPVNPALLQGTSLNTSSSNIVQSEQEERHPKRQQLGAAFEPYVSYSENYLKPLKSDSPTPSALGDLPTPPASSIISRTSYGSPAEDLAVTRQLPASIQTSNDPRRLSVNSLLSSPTVQENANQMLSYGIDRGFADLDRPRNEDHHVLEGSNAVSSRSSDSSLFDGGSSRLRSEFGFRLSGAGAAHGKDGYYSNSVLVTIPRSLEPLPPVLLENQMNLLYFHHFLNHTARILVPHDCSENPFRIILPQSMLFE